MKPLAPQPTMAVDPKKKAAEIDVQNEASRAQNKLTNFGLELFKFLAPAEIATYSIDSEYSAAQKKIKRGYQGTLANNQAWWTDSVHYLWDIYKKDPTGVNGIKDWVVGDSSLGPLIREESQADIDTVARSDWLVDPYNTGIYNDKQNIHFPSYGDYNTSDYMAKFFGRTHRTTPFLSRGQYSGASHGRLLNINPFVGIAGGYGDAKLDTNNTWNHFEVNEEKKNTWDDGMSTGFQSTFGLDDNASYEWDKMNGVLTEISKQTIPMKNAHRGYQYDGFHINNTDPFRQWSVDASSTEYAEFGAKSAHISKMGDVSTQAPNYFEIINSGAWSKWTTDQTALTDPNTAGTLSKNNINGEKFYYFLKAMLESKRRGLEAYRHILGKVENLTSMTADDYNNFTKGQTGGPWTKLLKTTRAQSKDIKEWYDNVSSKVPYANTFYNFLFFKITHGLFNQLEALPNGGLYGGSYTEIGEYGAFLNASVYGSYKYMKDQIGSYVSGTDCSLDSVDENNGRNIVTNLIKLSIKLQRKFNDLKSQLATAQNDDESTPEKAATKSGKIADIKTKLKTVLKAINFIAPISEFYSRSTDVKDDELKDFKAPIVDYAHYDSNRRASGNADTDITKVSLSQIPRSLWDGSPDGDVKIVPTHKAYDSYALLRGHGLTGWGPHYKVDGSLALARMNPVDGIPTDIKYVKVNSDLGDAVGYLKDGIYDSADVSKLMQRKFRSRFYGNTSGKYSTRQSASDSGADLYRGGVLEIDENAAFAGAAYNYDATELRDDDMALSTSFTYAEIQRGRRERRRYKEKMQAYEDQQMEEARFKAAIEAKSRQRQQEHEAAMEAAAQRRRAQDQARQRQG